MNDGKGESGRGKVSLLLLTAAVVSFSLFLALGYLVGYESLNKQDIFISRSLASFRPAWLIALMKGVSFIGYFRGGGIIAILTAAYLIALKLRTAAIFLLVSLLVMIPTNFFKSFFDRPRPTAALIGFQPISANDPSYPSGHAAFSAALYGFMLLLVILMLGGKAKKVFAGLLTFVVITVAFSRIFLGAHYLSDVIGGLLLGGAMVLALGAALGGRQYRSYR